MRKTDSSKSASSGAKPHRRRLKQGVALTALLAAALSLSARFTKSEQDEAVTFEALNWQSSRVAGASIDPAAGAAAADQPDPPDPHVMGPEMRQLAAKGAALGLLSAMVAALGPNRVLQMLADMALWVLRMARFVLSHPVKAAGRAARVVGRVAKDSLKGPGRWLLIVGGLGLFAFTGIALFDHQWSIGILVGLSLGYFAAAGVAKMGKASARLWQKFRPHEKAPHPQTAHDV